MFDGRWTRVLYGAGILTLAVALAVSVVRAQTGGFEARRAEVLRQGKAEQQAAQLAGDTNRAKLYRLYPTPELQLAKALLLAPGSSAPIAISGRFDAKTTFLSQVDGVALASPAVGANSFRATATAAPGLPPLWASVYAFAPVSGAWASVPAVLVGSPLSFRLAASNGWTVSLTPRAKAFVVERPGRATVDYEAGYLKPGSTTPFRKMAGTLTLLPGSTPGSYSFSMQAGDAGSAQAEMMAIAKQMQDLMAAGKLDSPEIPRLQEKLEAAQERMAKEVEAQMKDPAAMLRAEEEFGCGTINLSVSGRQVKGSVACGSRIGTLRLTGQL